jgi:hypothetical protein
MTVAEQDPTSSPDDKGADRSPRGWERGDGKQGERPKEEPGVQGEGDLLEDTYDPNAVVH